MCFVKRILVFGFGVALALSIGAEAVDPQKDTTSRLVDAVAKLNQDPLLGTEKIERTLTWISSDEPTPPADTAIPAWLKALRQWLNEGARVLLWVLGAIGALWLAWKLGDFLRARERITATQRSVTSHVRDLDIRPESLPSDIGAHALAQWQGGEVAQALSLLYRGALSRLVHGFQLPVLASSTEGECLRLANEHLQTDSAQFVAILIHTWLRAVYARRTPTEDTMQRLCGDFSRMLDAAVTTPPESQSP